MPTSDWHGGFYSRRQVRMTPQEVRMTPSEVRVTPKEVRFQLDATPSRLVEDLLKLLA